MQSEFETVCTKARDEISVPEFSIAAIRARHERTAPSKRGRRGVFAAIAIGLSMAAISAATVVNHASFTLTKSGGILITAPTITGNFRATEADVIEAASKMDFKVTLPIDLPPGTKVKNLMVFGTNGLAIGYDLPGEWRRSHHYMNVVILEPTTLRGTPAEKRRMELLLLHRPSVRPKGAAASVWRIGHEDVLIQTSLLTPAEAAKIKAAMQKEAAR
ncbi:MAG TPA: hypothetical protein VFL13_13700, partial [Candidatus Baltobacteraceae bacterium]|nr:hypothetical protein [Candidatus Baltobacteraceae bacterium]